MCAVGATDDYRVARWWHRHESNESIIYTSKYSRPNFLTASFTLIVSYFLSSSSHFLDGAGGVGIGVSGGVAFSTGSIDCGVACRFVFGPVDSSGGILCCAGGDVERVVDWGAVGRLGNFTNGGAGLRLIRDDSNEYVGGSATAR